MKNLAHEVHWWLVCKGEEEQCIWPVTLNEELQTFLPPFSYCQSPLWTPLGINIPNHRSISKIVAIYEMFIEKFIVEYGVIAANLHHSLWDVRAFDWWNYGKPLPKFKIKPRYTAVIKNLKISEKELIKNFRTNRRRELQKFKKHEHNFYFNDNCSIKEFISLYKEKLRIEKDVTNQDLINVMEIVEKGYGWVLAARRKEDSMLIGLIIVFNSKDVANLVINIVMDKYKKQWLNVYIEHF